MHCQEFNLADLTNYFDYTEVCRSRGMISCTCVWVSKWSEQSLRVLRFQGSQTTTGLMSSWVQSYQPYPLLSHLPQLNSGMCLDNESPHWFAPHSGSVCVCSAHTHRDTETYIHTAIAFTLKWIPDHSQWAGYVQHINKTRHTNRVVMTLSHLTVIALHMVVLVHGHHPDGLLRALSGNTHSQSDPPLHSTGTNNQSCILRELGQNGCHWF